jgi:hypothetical protein
MKRTSLINLLAGAILVLGIICVYKCCIAPPCPPPPTCCEQHDTCDLPAPQNLFAELEQNPDGTTLNISWDSVPGAKFYYVDVMDVTSDTFVYANVKVFGDSIDLPFPTFDPKNEYKIAVTCVCENCIASSYSAMYALCPIVIEDIVYMRCTEDACDCSPGNDITPGGGGRTIYFPGGTFIKLYRVEVNCNGVESKFPIEVERQSGSAGINVRVLNAAALGCPAGDILNPPTDSGYPGNVVGNGTGRYSVSFTCNQMTFDIPDGCTWRLLECTGCK